MANSTSKPMTVRTTEQVREDFKRTYEESGATSQNEFLWMLLKKWVEPKEINKIPSDSKPIEIPSILTPEETQTILESSFEASEASSIDEFLDLLLLKFNARELLKKINQNR